MDFRQIVKAAMARQQMSQSALARACSVPRPNLSDWLAGKTDINSDTLARVFSALGVRVRA